MTPPKHGKQTTSNSTPERCKSGQEPEIDRSYRIMLADMRDRMRAPVNAVIEYSELLLEDAKEQGRDELASDLIKIHALGKRLCAVVDASLDETALAAAKTGREMRVFSANLRHELRTPLNAIIGYSEMLIEDAAADGSNAFVPDLEKIRGAGQQFLV